MKRAGSSVSKLLATVAFGLAAYIAAGLINPDLIGNRTETAETELRWSAPIIGPGEGPVPALAGYTISCWNVAYHSVEILNIDDPASTSSNLDTLPPGAYQCAVQAVLDDGSKSALSNVVTRNIP